MARLRDNPPTFEEAIASTCEAIKRQVGAIPQVRVVDLDYDKASQTINYVLEMPRWLAIETGLVEPGPIEVMVMINKPSEQGGS